MRRYMLGVLVGLLCVTPLLAQPHSRSSATHPAGPPLFQEVKETRFLFIPLTAEEVRGAEGPLELRINLNGSPYIEEDLSLEGIQEAKEPSFELLAMRPDLLDRLYDLSRAGENQITVEVFLDGAALRELSFQELRRNNQQLKTKPFHPVSAPSRVRDLSDNGSTEPSESLALMAANGVQREPTCVNACTQDYYACMVNCSEESDPYCTWCQSQYDNCVDRCPIICVNPKSVREEIRSVELWSYNSGVECFQNASGTDPNWGTSYIRVIKTYHDTTVRITENCDGSTSETILSVRYATRGCWRYTGYPCHQPIGPLTGGYCSG